jgi:hypothetical protein
MRADVPAVDSAAVSAAFHHTTSRRVIMRKLSLQVESLEVESFRTSRIAPMRGTAYAHDGGNGHGEPNPDQVLGWPEKPPQAGTAYPEATCYGTCYFSCGCSI